MRKAEEERLKLEAKEREKERIMQEHEQIKKKTVRDRLEQIKKTELGAKAFKDIDIEVQSLLGRWPFRTHQTRLLAKLPGKM